MELCKVILTSLLFVGALFAIAKIMGHKQMAQLGDTLLTIVTQKSICCK